MKEKVKKDENKPATTSLAINLEQDVEQNMIELSGEVVTCPSFYRIDGDGASGSELPTLIMAIPLMVKHATEGYALWMKKRLRTMNSTPLDTMQWVGSYKVFI